MNKGILVSFLALCMVGCTVAKEKYEMYVDNPEFLIKDPHFHDYKEKRDALEKEYLTKKITYAEYLSKKEELDQVYNHDVQKREHILNQDNP